jgi:hypothetical protein
MKKLILLFWVFLSLCAQYANAQCTPDPNLTYNGVSPDGLPPAMAGYYYTSTLSFKIPKDTSIQSINVTVDSAKFIYATGQPAGFSFTCNNPGCVWPGGGKGCALFYGMVESNFTDSVKEFQMKIYTRTWYRFTGGTDQFSRIDSATNYTFRIVKYNGIAELTTYERLTAYPNPTTGKVTIELRDLANDAAEVNIMDAFGKLIYKTTVSDNNRFLNTLSVDLGNYSPGMYVITVKSGNTFGQTKVVLN